MTGRGHFILMNSPKSSGLNIIAGNSQLLSLTLLFTGVPEKETFSKWYSETPKDFTISLKGSRSITHVKKLKSPAEPLDVFFSRITALREKLGVVLWQFPPDFKADTGKLKDFLEALSQYKVRNTFEFRDKSWINRQIISLLGKNNTALCLADWPDFYATRLLPLISYISGGTELTGNTPPAIRLNSLGQMQRQ